MKAVVLVRLEIEGDQAQAFEVVDKVLDEGVLQDAIAGYADASDGGALEVTSAQSEAAAAVLTPEERTLLSECLDLAGASFDQGYRRYKERLAAIRAKLVGA